MSVPGITFLIKYILVHNLLTAINVSNSQNGPVGKYESDFVTRRFSHIQIKYPYREQQRPSTAISRFMGYYVEHEEKPGYYEERNAATAYKDNSL